MQRTKPKKKRTGLKIFLTVLAIFVVGAFAYGYSVWHNVNKTVNSVHKPIERTPEVKRPTELELTEKEPFSVLILGIDQTTGDRGRSDTMIVVTVNPNTNSMEMVSIPRDSRVPIIGKGIDDKIGHAYAFGGVEMAMNTVESYLDIPIDYYIKMNMSGFKDIVDAVGGVTVKNDLEFSQGGHHFPKGTIELNGEQALSYARMRKKDSRGDFGRQMRQRQVIEGVLEKGANITALWKYDNILTAISDNVETNLTLDDIVEIQRNYASARHNIQQREMTGKGKFIGKIWYLIVSEEERASVSALLKEHLEI